MRETGYKTIIPSQLFILKYDNDFLSLFDLLHVIRIDGRPGLVHAENLGKQLHNNGRRVQGN